MQELEREMKMRIASLERRREYLATQRSELQSEIAQIETELRENETLTGQYRQVVDTLPKPA